LTRYLTRW